MIVCHQYRFIFLKTNKTAGTSVEMALSRFCSKGDIVTHHSDEEEQQRSELGGLAPKLYPTPKYKYTPRDWHQYLTRGKEKQFFYNHLPARKMKKRLPPEVWDNYFRFCVVRNPWDRVISQYHWRYRKIDEDKRPLLDEFLDSTHARSLIRKGYELYTINGEPQVDFFCRYESLAEDLEIVRQKLKLPEPLELPQAKSAYRKKKGHYRELFNEAQCQRVADMFADEIALHGYTF